jgi:hypothetical protein
MKENPQKKGMMKKNSKDKTIHSGQAGFNRSA